MNGTPAPVRVVMVAIGGYGYYYLRTLLDEVPPAEACLAGVVDPEARQSRAWHEVETLGVPVCSTVEEYYGAGRQADLAVVVSPIHFHVPQSCAALAAGSDVLCDKPLGATVAEARELIAARDRSGRRVSIGYQWSFSDAIQALKRDILDGVYGRPARFSAVCCWPRDLGYYRRNRWAGRLRDPDGGRWVLDSPANNAMAHSLHNLLYLAGGSAAESATPRRVQAELYRAYPIESCDTVACRVATDGPEILFLASHCTERPIEPRFRLEFERGQVAFGEQIPQIVGANDRGLRKVYGAPDDTPQFRKLFEAIRAVRSRAPVVCGPEAAAAQTLVVNGMHRSAREILPFPDQAVKSQDGHRQFVPGLGETLLRCYERGMLPAECGAPWAMPGRTVEEGSGL